MPPHRRHVVKFAPVKTAGLAILCTMGPRVSRSGPDRRGRYPEPGALTGIPELVEQGMAAARINMSHVRPEGFAEVEKLIAAIRRTEEELRRPLPIILDLKGPKIRIREIRPLGPKGPLEPVDRIAVSEGDRVQIVTCDTPRGRVPAKVKARLCVAYPLDLYVEIDEGNTIVVGDNEVYLKAERKDFPDRITCVAEHSGTIKLNKGIDLPQVPGGRLQAGPLDVPEDTAAINHGFDVDFIAQSFVQGPSDVCDMAGLLQKSPTGPKPIIAKIESPAAVANVDAILARDEVYGIMVARGDLGVLVDYPEIPKVQRRLIDRANIAGKPVIVATQLLESMIRNPLPQRGEVQDIATAVEEGADTLMLSGETAVGDFPLACVKVMSRVVEATMPIDRDRYIAKFAERYTREPATRNIHVLGYPIVSLAEQAGAPLIVSWATTGASATMISRFRPSMPVVAVTNRVETARQLRLLYGVYPVLVDTGLDAATGKPADLPRTPEGAVAFTRAVVSELGLANRLKVKGRLIVVTLHNGLAGEFSRSVITFRW
ncbi:MAG: pyruvate kinase [bacterium]